MEFQAWYFGFECVFCTTFAINTDEVEVVLLSCILRDTMTCTVLPDIALLTCNTVTAIVLFARSVSSTALIQE